mmetsp:Transcript_2319/g.6404  ORF Transcript_2319/g.6404 Transcript_2319/m.6404 type:complete len:214 (-) Transcript_2319:106-747(-)
MTPHTISLIQRNTGLPEERAQLRFIRTCVGRLDLLIVQNDEGRHHGDLVLAGQLVKVIDVHREEGALVHARELRVDWLNSVARFAPCRSELRHDVLIRTCRSGCCHCKIVFVFQHVDFGRLRCGCGSCGCRCRCSSIRGFHALLRSFGQLQLVSNPLRQHVAIGQLLRQPTQCQCGNRNHTGVRDAHASNADHHLCRMLLYVVCCMLCIGGVV